MSSSSGLNLPVRRSISSILLGRQGLALPTHITFHIDRRTHALTVAYQAARAADTGILAHIHLEEHPADLIDILQGIDAVQRTVHRHIVVSLWTGLERMDDTPADGIGLAAVGRILPGYAGTAVSLPLQGNSVRQGEGKSPLNHQPAQVLEGQHSGYQSALTGLPLLGNAGSYENDLAAGESLPQHLGMGNHRGIHRCEVLQGIGMVLLDEAAEGRTGGGDEILILSCGNAPGIFLGHGIGSDGRLLGEGEAELEQHCLHLGEALKTEGGYEGRGNARHHIVPREQEGVHLLLLAVDDLGILRADYRTASAEDTPFLDDLRLMVLDLNGFHRAFPETFVAVLAPGFLKFEIFFHKSGLSVAGPGLRLGQAEPGIHFGKEFFLYIVLVHAPDEHVRGAVESLLGPHYDSVGALSEAETGLKLDELLHVVLAEHFLHALDHVVGAFEVAGA